MKLCRIIALFGALMASSIPSAFAASTLKAAVPFAFVVGNRMMPAGEYTIASSSNGPIVLYIHGMGSGVAVISAPSTTGAQAMTPGLVFEIRGTQRYLVGVRMADAPGRAVPEPAFKQSSLSVAR